MTIVFYTGMAFFLIGMLQVFLALRLRRLNLNLKEA
jgi:hypothetical protein